MGASVERIEGVVSADLNFASGTLLIHHDPSVDPAADVARTVEASGHGAVRLDETGAAAEPGHERPWFERNRAEIAAFGSGTCLALGALMGWFGMPEQGTVVFYALAVGFGGFLVWRRALVSLRARVLDMNVLMSVAVFGAGALGEWGEGATVFFLFSVGGLLESRALERTRRSIRDLMDLAPETARVRRDGRLFEVAVGDVAVGESIVVRPGERIPLDGTVSLGASAVDEAVVTGESVPADKEVGDRVFAGTLNRSGLLEVAVIAPATGSTLARIVYLVEEAQASRAPSQRFVDRFSSVYTPAVIALAVGMAVVPPVLIEVVGTAGPPFAEWVRRALVILVVSCPCALVISTPVSIVSAVTRASRDGVLVKGGVFLETASRIRAVALDKTGTLTVGQPAVRAVFAMDGHSETEVLGIAAALESHSNHPVARAVVEAAGEAALRGKLSDFVETPGRGVSALLDGTHYELCSPACARESASFDGSLDSRIAALEDDGMSVLALLGGGAVVGLIGVADTPRPDAAAAVARLRDTRVEHVVMLTGDNERVAAAVARETGLTEYRAALLPQDKTRAVEELRRRYGSVAMVGDGVNDAPALAAADIGIALAAAGSDTALETADVALMGDDLSAVAGFLDLGRRTMWIIGQNVVFSIGVKALFLGLALTGHATLWMAVFADTGVSLLVILNGMRLLRSRT